MPPQRNHISLIALPTPKRREHALENDLKQIVQKREDHILSGIGFTGFANKRDCLRLGLLQLAAVARSVGWSVSYHHATQDWWDAGRSPLRTIVATSTVIGLQSITASYPLAQSLLAKIRELDPDVCVIIGGPHVTFNWSDACDDGFNAVFLGDAERSLKIFLQHFANQAGQVLHIPGLIECIRGKRKSRHLPCGHRGALDPGDITADSVVPAFDVVPEDLLASCHPVFETSRGCKNRCSFCVEGSLRRGWRPFRSPRLINAVGQWRDSDSSSMVGCLADSDLFADEGSALQALDMLGNLHRTYGLRWRVQFRADSVTETICKRIPTSGIVMSFIGVESTVDEVLSKACRDTTWAKTRYGLGLVADRIPVRMVGIVFGLPGQKRSHLPRILADTEELVARNLATEVSVTRFVPYPGTAVFNNPGRFGFARRQVPWELYQRREIRVADLVSQEDYAAFQRDKDYETLLRLSSDN